MIGTFGGLAWVHTSMGNSYTASDYAPYYTGAFSSSAYFDGSSFKGAFTHCVEGCNSNYVQAAADWCDIYNNLHDHESPCALTCPQQWQTQSLCVTFNLLLVAMIVFTIFEVISMIGIAVWAAVMLCFLKKIQKCFCLTYCCAVGSCVSHYIAIIGWLILSGGSYQDDCGDFPSNGDRIKLCNNDGPGLALLVMIFFPAVVASYFVVACLAYRRKDVARAGAVEVNPVGESGPMGLVPQYSPGTGTWIGNGNGQAGGDLPVYKPVDGAHVGDPSAPQYVIASAPQYVPASAPQYVPASATQYVPASAPQYVPASAPHYVPASAHQYALASAPQYHSENQTPLYVPENHVIDNQSDFLQQYHQIHPPLQYRPENPTADDKPGDTPKIID